MTRKTALVSLLLLLGITLGAQAQPPHRPPPEAYEACADARTGDACEVTLGERTLSGTCETDRDDGLVCRPEPPPPPREAFDACEDASEGDACEVTMGERTIQGVCEAHGGSELFCHPERPHGHGHGGERGAGREGSHQP